MQRVQCLVLLGLGLGLGLGPGLLPTLSIGWGITLSPTPSSLFVQASSVSSLPGIETVLETLHISYMLNDFIRMGVTDTRLLLRLNAMDYQIMEMEWIEERERERERVKDAKQFTRKDLDALKAYAIQLKEKITETKSDAKRDRKKEDMLSTPHRSDYMSSLQQRRSIRYGRLYIANSVQSYEYVLATYGSLSPPVGPKRLTIIGSNPEKGRTERHFDDEEEFSVDNKYGCRPTLKKHLSPSTSALSSGEELNAIHGNGSDTYIVIHRGKCSFFQKSMYMKEVFPNAAGLIIVDKSERVDAPSSGFGVDRSISESMVMQFNKLHENVEYSVVAISRSTWKRIERSIRNNALYYDSSSPSSHAFVSLVPIRCGAGNTAKSMGSGRQGGAGGGGGGISGAVCRPVLRQEEEIAYEATCGTIQFAAGSPAVETSPTFDFLSANVGSTLPDSDHTGANGDVCRDVAGSKQEVEIAAAFPFDGCTPLTLPSDMSSNTTTTLITTITTAARGEVTTSTSTKTINMLTAPSMHPYYKNKAILIGRGNCSFETKLLNAQNVNGAYVVVMDNKCSNALEHMGVSSSSESEADIVTIPSILITKTAGDWLLDYYEAHQSQFPGSAVSAKLQLHRNNYYHMQLAEKFQQASIVNEQQSQEFHEAAGPHSERYPTIAHHWIELAHYPWAQSDAAGGVQLSSTDTCKEDVAFLTLRTQLNDLIEKYKKLQIELVQYLAEKPAYCSVDISKDCSAAKENGDGAHYDIRHRRISGKYYDNIISWLENKLSMQSQSQSQKMEF